MSPDRLAQMGRCYRQWNGSAVMEGAFAELLAEVMRLRAEAVESRAKAEDEKFEYGQEQYSEGYGDGTAAARENQ
jgi:hypothetical protein